MIALAQEWPVTQPARMLPGSAGCRARGSFGQLSGGNAAPRRDLGEHVQRLRDSFRGALRRPVEREKAASVLAKAGAAAQRRRPFLAETDPSGFYSPGRRGGVPGAGFVERRRQTGSGARHATPAQRVPTPSRSR